MLPKTQPLPTLNPIKAVYISLYAVRKILGCKATMAKKIRTLIIRFGRSENNYPPGIYEEDLHWFRNNFIIRGREIVPASQLTLTLWRI